MNPETAMRRAAGMGTETLGALARGVQRLRELAERRARLHRAAPGDDIERTNDWIAQTVFIIAGALIATISMIAVLGA